jgi:hypothetical protein
VTLLNTLRRGLAKRGRHDRDWHKTATPDELLDEVDSHVRWVRTALQDPDETQIEHARRRLSDAEALLAELEDREDAYSGSGGDSA